MNFQEILDFWFKKNSKRWFEKSESFDQEIKEKFKAIHLELNSGKHQDWKSDPHSLLAMIIVLDQFSRNMFRNDKRSFTSDPLAKSLAELAIKKGFDKKLTPVERAFVYLPFEHSEELSDQEKSLELFNLLKQIDEKYDFYFEYAKKHHEIILRFGRFPHRNKILERNSTSEEIEFLKQKGSSF